jgi:hypothetical protein
MQNHLSTLEERLSIVDDKIAAHKMRINMATRTLAVVRKQLVQNIEGYKKHMQMLNENPRTPPSTITFVSHRPITQSIKSGVPRAKPQTRPGEYSVEFSDSD